MADQPFASVPSLSDRLCDVMDIEGKIPRALEALGPLAGRQVTLIDVPGTPWVDRVRSIGVDPVVVPTGWPIDLPVDDGSQDAVVALWTAFRGVDAADLAEVDRTLRPGGRLLVVHDYGRDDIATLRDPDSPEFRSWSRRNGPFLQGAGFKIRVVHCFWTFTSLDHARETLELFGERGAAVAAGLNRPRLSWNVAVYHRWRGGQTPPD